MRKWTWQGIMAGIGTIFLAIYAVSLLVGCNESVQVPAGSTVIALAGGGEQVLPPTPKVKPLNAHMLPTPQNWKDAYGDTLATQLVFNAAVGGRDDKVLQSAAMQIAGVIRNVHAGDPNEVMWRESVEARLDVLETKVNDLEELRDELLIFGNDEDITFEQDGEIMGFNARN